VTRSVHARLSDRIAAASDRSPLPLAPDILLGKRLLIETAQNVSAQSEYVKE